MVLKQGTLTSESSGADDMAQKSARSDDLHIEQFSLDDRQKKLRQEFVNRSDRSLEELLYFYQHFISTKQIYCELNGGQKARLQSLSNVNFVQMMRNRVNAVEN